jgi:hypothetical protein
MKVLKFLNDNQGAVMTFLTALYVITTLGVVWLMMKANKLARKSFEKAIESERRRSRPYVVFNIITSTNHDTYAAIKNYGLNSAFYIKVSIEPKLIYNEGIGDTGVALTSQKIPFLPPGEEITELIDQSATFFERYKGRQSFQGSIEYQDSPESDAVCYKEEFLIDLSFRKKRSLLPEKLLADEVRELNETLTVLSKSLKER